MEPKMRIEAPLSPHDLVVRTLGVLTLALGLIGLFSRLSRPPPASHHGWAPPGRPGPSWGSAFSLWSMERDRARTWARQTWRLSHRAPLELLATWLVC